jgi:hypothetical protein
MIERKYIMAYFLQQQWNTIDSMIAETKKSEESKILPLGFTKFNARDTKDVHIPVFKPRNDCVQSN